MFVFFHKTLLWLPRGRRPLRVPLLLPLSMRAPSKRINFCKLHTFSFFGTVSGRIAQEGPPNEFFCTFFGSVFGRACIRPRYVKSLRSDFFLQRKKSAFKWSYRVRGMGPPPGTRFCMYCYHTKQNTKAKTKKKHKFCLGFLYQINILCFHNV